MCAVRRYGVPEGFPAFRTALSAFLERCGGYLAPPEELFLTDGVSGALALLATWCVAAHTGGHAHIHTYTHRHSHTHM